RERRGPILREPPQNGRTFTEKETEVMVGEPQDTGKPQAVNVLCVCVCVCVCMYVCVYSTTTGWGCIYVRVCVCMCRSSPLHWMSVRISCVYPCAAARCRSVMPRWRTE